MVTKKKPGKVDLTTGEIVEEIEERVAHRLNQGVQFRHPFHRHAVTVKFTKPSMTHESHAESCDINYIIRQFDRTGLLPPSNRGPGQYGDVSELNRPLTDLINDAKDTSEKFAQERAQKAAEKKAAAANPASQSEATPPSNNPAPATPPPAAT